MLIKSFIAALLSTNYISRAHEAFEDLYVSERSAEQVPALEPYGIEYFLDLPLDITTEFFNEQVVDPEILAFREHSVLANDDSEAPKWIIWFTVENNSNYTCKRC